MTPQRPSLAKGFILELDGLRGLAILLVMVHRFWPRSAVGTAADVAGAGWIGVDLFFVISGFLIAGILLDTRGEPGYFRNFYARRVLRIFPLYYLFVIGVWIVFAGNPAFREHAGSPLWYLFHLGNVPEGLLDKDVPYWLAPTWSLAIEEQFYLTFPLLVYFLDRRKLTFLLVGMVVAAPAIRTATMLALPDQERVQYLFTLCRIDTIAVGCLLAIVVRTVDMERWRKRAMLVTVATLPGVVILGIASGLERTSPFDRVFGYSLVAVGCASVVAVVVLSRGQRSTALLRWQPITYLGKLCFGLYLLHRPADTFVSAVAARVGFQRELWLLPVKIIVAVVLATVSWRLLERPFLHLKDRFASARHPGGETTTPPPRLPPFMLRALRMLGILLVISAFACSPRETPAVVDDPRADDASRSPTDGPLSDATRDPDDAAAAADASTPDAPPPPPPGPVLYTEGSIHSPITSEIVSRLQSIATTQPAADRVFAKVGDSITASTDFVRCFDGSNVNLGSHGGLAATLSYFKAGDAAGTSPFQRESVAAKGGTTARDALAGSPCPLDQEVAALDPRYAVVLFGTNEVRYGWTLDQYGSNLWALVDKTIARGVVPILSTMPANVGYPEADAKIPTYNRVVRAIAQGRGVPLVDFHRALADLPNRGISNDGLHPSSSPSGACVLTDAGLQYGYNVRNLITLQALKRTRAAVAGTASDTNAPTRTGAGRAANPYRGAIPFVDLAYTRDGEALVATPGCGSATSGHEVVYRIQLPSQMTISAHVVDRDSVDVDVRIIADGSCRAAHDATATATVGPGDVDIVVDARSIATDGEFLLVVERR